MLATLSVLLALGAGDDVSISEAKTEDGVLIHEVKSPYQAGMTKIRVLRPDVNDKGQKYPWCTCCRSKREPRTATATG